MLRNFEKIPNIALVLMRKPRDTLKSSDTQHGDNLSEINEYMIDRYGQHSNLIYSSVNSFHISTTILQLNIFVFAIDSTSAETPRRR